MNPDRLLNRSFVMVWLASLAMGLSWTLFIHFPGFLEELGATEVEIGLIFGIAALASVAVRPAVGRGMDLHGRRMIIILGSLLNAGAISLYLTVGAVDAWAYVVRIIHGLATATLFTALFTYAADFVPARRRTQGLALFGVSGMLPIALGGIIGDVILSTADFDVLFIAALGFAAVSLLLTLPLRDAAPDTESAGRRSFLAAALQADLLPLWWMTLVFSVALAAYFTFLKTFVLEVGFGSVGLFFGFYAGVAIAERVFAGWLPDRVGEKRVFFPALAVFAAGFVVLASAGSASALALAGAMCGAGHGYAFPILYGMVITRARATERGSAMATYTALFDIGALLGGPIFGLVIDVGSYGAMWLTAAATVVFGATVFAMWDRVAELPVAIEAEARA